MKSKLLIVYFASFLLLKCSPQLNYLGNSYPPTNKATLYFDAKEIDQEYKIIGLLNFKIGQVLFNQEDNYLTNLILNKAKKVGADAAIITRFSNETYQEIDENINTIAISTKEYENLNIEAKFIKFKD